MADYNSSLPVRTQANGDVVAFLADGTVNTQLLSITATGHILSNLYDGAGTAITSQLNGAQQALDIGINVAGVQIDPRQIRVLTSGTDSVSAVQGTSPWVTKDQSDGPVTPGVVASFSQLMGGQFNTVLPTLTNGQQAAIQVDSSGRLLSSVTLSEDQNYGTVGATTLRTASQIGNATGAADFNAGATGAQTLRVQANQGAPNTAANGWPVKPTDGTNSQSFTASGEAKVDMTSSFEDQNFGTVGATTLRTAAQIGNATGAADFNFGTVGAQTLRVASQIGNATGAADFNNGATGAQTLRVAANLAIGGANVSNTNPVPVTMDVISGTSINDFKDAASIAVNASDNHDYTVTAGKTFYFDQVESSGSGKAKMLISVETGVATGVFTTYFVQFNSTSETNMSVKLSNPISVTAGVRVRVVMTNRDNQAQDLYSTISGKEV